MVSPGSAILVALSALAPALAGCSVTAASPHVLVPPAPATAAASACWIELAADDQPGAYAIAGPSEFHRWLVTYSAILVRHPRGDVLVDTGPSADFDALVQTAQLSSRLFLRLLLDSAMPATSAPAALARAGEKVSDVHAIVLSHVHADHAGGVVDLPDIPVYLGAPDVALARAEKDSAGFDVLEGVAESIAPRARPVVFSGPPYETFDRSFDLYGDGTIVLVPLPGHTPGSLGPFVNLPGLRIFHVGDATDSFEAVRKRRSKSLPLGLTDRDKALADETLAKITQLHEMDPALVILPAHDRRVWNGAFGAPGRCFPPATRRAPTAE